MENLTSGLRLGDVDTDIRQFGYHLFKAIVLLYHVIHLFVCIRYLFVRMKIKKVSLYSRWFTYSL